MNYKYIIQNLSHLNGHRIVKNEDGTFNLFWKDKYRLISRKYKEIHDAK